MTFLLLNLLQPQTRLSWVVIAAAVIAFSAGVSLLVYFYKRYKRIEKETEEDWDASRHSLFVNAVAPASKSEVAEKAASSEADSSSRHTLFVNGVAEPKIEDASATETAEPEAPAAEEPSTAKGGTREFASDLVLPSFAQTTLAEPKPPVEIEPPVAPIQPQTPAPPEPRPTEILASPQPVPPVTEPSHEAASFDEEIWSGLEIAEQSTHAVDHKAAPQTSTEPLTFARVDQPSQREPFEPPTVERISHQEPYQPPTIKPITPREAAATRELRSPATPAIVQPGRSDERMSRGTARFGSLSEDISRPLETPSLDRETREVASDLVAVAPVTAPERTVSAGAVTKARFGSVLGLPAEASHQPLILGEPVRPADETGIGGLTHYGQDLGPKGGHAGIVALLAILALLGGATAVYFFVSSVHADVNAFIARLRGTQTQDRDALKPKAQIIPSSRPDVNKNMVTARGAVDNIADEPLLSLEVEVSLQRGGDAPPEIRRVPVTPDPLPAGERGTFEFEYDGKRDTGFASYTITRLLSNGTEVRFRTPAQK